MTNQPQSPKSSKSLEERLRDHIVWVSLGMIITGFVAGIGAAKFFLALTGQDTILKDKKVWLENIAKDYKTIEQENKDLKKQLEKEELTASITIPQEGNKVIGKIDVRGKASRQLTENEHLWLFVHLQGSIAWEPQASEIILNNDKTWESEALIGDESENVGRNVELVVVLADDTANTELNQYLLKIKETGDWTATTLPNGVMLKDKINVIRK
jgi:hypothetical protein